MLPNLTLYKKGKLTDLEGRGREKVQNLREKKKKQPSNNLLEKRETKFSFFTTGNQR